MKRHNGVTNRFGCVFQNGAHVVVRLDLEASLGGELSFTVNGKDMHRAFVNIDRDGPKYYPAIELSSGAEVYVKGDVFETPRTVTWRQVQRSKLQRERLDHLKAELRRASQMTESASELVKALRKFGTTLEYIPMKSRQGVSWEQVQKDLCRERVVICGKPVTDHLAAKGGLPELERILVSAVGEHYWSNMDSHSSTLRPLRLRGSALWHCTHEMYVMIPFSLSLSHTHTHTHTHFTTNKKQIPETSSQVQSGKSRIICGAFV